MRAPLTTLLLAGIWVAGLTIAACSYDVDPDLCLSDEHCNDDEVCTAGQRCLVCAGAACPPHTRCIGDQDCRDDEVCAGDDICRPRCVVDAQCPLSGLCKEPVCAAAFGEPCQDYDTPCADRCAATDNRLQPVEPYCTTRCFPESCPPGYECISDECLIITGEPVCQHPNPAGICGACLWENCGSDLQDCCEGQICGDVLGQIAQCDVDRTLPSCAPLANPANYAATSFELVDCMDLFCDDGECHVGN